MAQCPPQYVDAPAVQPRPGGLFASAIFPPAEDHFWCGVEFESPSCVGKAFTTHDPCREEGPRTVTATTYGTGLAPSNRLTAPDGNFKAADVGRTLTGLDIPAGTTIAVVVSATEVTMSATVATSQTGPVVVGPAPGFPEDLGAGGGSGRSLISAGSFTVYAGFECALVGGGLVDAEGRAAKALAFGEQRAVEYAYWTGSEGNRPRLADPAATILGTAVSPDRGQALLERFLAVNYGGVGVIHAPVELAFPFPETTEGDVASGFTSPLGTKVIYGAGYSVANTGPDGAAAPAGTAWAYATGAVAVWRSPVDYNPTPVEQALNRGTNRVELLAHRTYVVAHECVLAAVNITLP